MCAQLATVVESQRESLGSMWPLMECDYMWTVNHPWFVNDKILTPLHTEHHHTRSSGVITQPFYNVKHLARGLPLKH